MNSGTGTISIGADAAVHTVTIGSTTLASATIIRSGTGALGIGNDAVAKTIIVGNTTGTTSLLLQ